MTDFSKTLNNKIGEWENINDELYRSAAKAVALQLIANRDGMIPGGMMLNTFVGKMAEDKSFRAVMKPLFDEIHNEMRTTLKAKAGEEQHLKSADFLLARIEDGSVLRAFGLETRSAKLGKPGAGVKQIKTLAQTKAEEAGSQEAAVLKDKKPGPEEKGPQALGKDNDPRAGNSNAARPKEGVKKPQEGPVKK